LESNNPNLIGHLVYKDDTVSGIVKAFVTKECDAFIMGAGNNFWN
jgi:hypothetical protein